MSAYTEDVEFSPPPSSLLLVPLPMESIERQKIRQQLARCRNMKAFAALLVALSRSVTERDAEWLDDRACDWVADRGLAIPGSGVARFLASIGQLDRKDNQTPTPPPYPRFGSYAVSGERSALDALAAGHGDGYTTWGLQRRQFYFGWVADKRTHLHDVDWVALVGLAHAHWKSLGVTPGIQIALDGRPLADLVH